MGVVFMLGILLIKIIATILIILFFTGIILLVIGIIMKKRGKLKPRSKLKPIKKISSRILIVIGTTMIVIPILIVISIYALGQLAILKESRRDKYFLVNAVNNDDYELVKHLLEEGVPADSNDYRLIGGNFVSNRNYQTPLWNACGKGNYEMVQLLLEYGADPDREGPNRDTCVEQVIYSKRYKILRLLLSNGANPNYTNYHGNTYLETAYKLRNLAAARILLEYGADPNFIQGDSSSLDKYKLQQYSRNELYIRVYNTNAA